MELKEGQVLKYKIHADEGEFYTVKDLHGNEFKLLKLYCYDQKYVKNQFLNLYSLSERKGDLFLTTKIPILEDGQVGALRVKDIAKQGYYLDNNSERDVLLPTEAVLGSIHQDEYILVRVIKKGIGLYNATMKVPKHLTVQKETIKLNQSIEGRVIAKILDVKNRRNITGVQVYLSSGLTVFVHREEMENIPAINDIVNVRILFIREDGKVNGSLKPHVKERLEISAEKILRYLYQQNGISPITDKNESQIIEDTFEMSKKAFKKALAYLISRKEVEIKYNKLILIKK